MRLYLIGGLGADERVFQFLDIETQITILDWQDPIKYESLASYSERLIQQINTKEKYSILGVSFGGIVAIEIAKRIKPEFLILISSVESSSQLPTKYISLGKTKFINMIPDALIKQPLSIMTYFFSAKNDRLLGQIINQTNPRFIRWAINKIIDWNSQSISVKHFRIHGDSDRLIPLKGNAIIIKGGGHFMIVDNAKEISNLVNGIIKNAG